MTRTEEEAVSRLYDDCMTLALHILGELEDINKDRYLNFAPKTREVMDRWRPKCVMLLSLKEFLK